MFSELLRAVQYKFALNTYDSRRSNPSPHGSMILFCVACKCMCMDIPELIGPIYDLLIGKLGNLN